MRCCSCLHNAYTLQVMPLWAVLNMVMIACAVLTCSARFRTALLLLTAACHAPDLLVTPASISAVERHLIQHLPLSQTNTTALQAMPFLAMVTFTLMVCTVANMLSTVQGHFAHAMRLNAKLVILISCASGIVSSAMLVALTRLIRRKMVVAMQNDNLPDNLKALGKVRQLCRGLAGAVVCRLLGNLLQASLQQQDWCCRSAAAILPAAGQRAPAGGAWLP